MPVCLSICLSVCLFLCVSLFLSLSFQLSVCLFCFPCFFPFNYSLFPLSSDLLSVSPAPLAPTLSPFFHTSLLSSRYPFLFDLPTPSLVLVCNNNWLDATYCMCLSNVMLVSATTTCHRLYPKYTMQVTRHMPVVVLSYIPTLWVFTPAIVLFLFRSHQDEHVRPLKSTKHRHNAQINLPAQVRTNWTERTDPLR